MPDVRSFQLYLLSFMRAGALVDSAREDLGATKAQMNASREKMLAAGVQRPGHQASLYVSILGEGFGKGTHESGNRYGAQSSRFRLPLWESLDFVVYSSIDGIVGITLFERPSDDVLRISSLDHLEPWKVVADDLLNGNWTCEVGDEWYPMKDLGCTHQSGRRVALCFDFGLLQKVEPIRQ